MRPERAHSTRGVEAVSCFAETGFRAEGFAADFPGTPAALSASVAPLRLPTFVELKVPERSQPGSVMKPTPADLRSFA